MSSRTASGSRWRPVPSRLRAVVFRDLLVAVRARAVGGLGDVLGAVAADRVLVLHLAAVAERDLLDAGAVAHLRQCEQFEEHVGRAGDIVAAEGVLELGARVGVGPVAARAFLEEVVPVGDERVAHVAIAELGRAGAGRDRTARRQLGARICGPVIVLAAIDDAQHVAPVRELVVVGHARSGRPVDAVGAGAAGAVVEPAGAVQVEHLHEAGVAHGVAGVGLGVVGKGPDRVERDLAALCVIRRQRTGPAVDESRHRCDAAGCRSPSRFRRAWSRRRGRAARRR